MRHLSNRYLSSTATASPVVLGADLNDKRLLKQQLAREISSLEGQLFRLRTRNDLIDYTTIHTYEEMIVSRQQMLNTLMWDE